MRDGPPPRHDRSMILETFIRDELAPVRLRLEDYLGGWLAIAFFPPGMASHPELARFEQLRAEFADQDALLLGASIDSWFELRTAPASFPLVADTRGLLAAAHGALADGEPRFGTVLIDPSGRVRHSRLGDGPSATAALQALRGLRGCRLLRLVA